ncbi:hypothetical protein TNCT_729251 [Trichonephila clavata]|uniref:Uncharacterized protein n=1 Tax=Trichonephila clavata TaxID=2740835 RepID=A0A8X6L2V6_TRICU|nr:hypothetical protein TNCT_729251 [Trichonephila clavata]
MRNALHFSGCLDQKLGHISHCLDTIKCTYSAALQRLFGPKASSYQSLSDTIKCTYSAALQRLFGPKAWSYQSLPGHHQVYLTVLHFSGCLDQKLGHISHCLDTIKCTYSAALQRLFGPKAWSYQSLLTHQVYLQC